MEKKSDAFNDFSIQDAMKLAKSDAGKQLFALLQQRQSDTLNSAMKQAASGDYQQVKKTVSELTADPEIKALLEQLRG